MTTIFVHIPKTGGTTLNTVLQREYQEGYFDENRARRDKTTRFAALDPVSKQSVTLLKGHIGFGIHRHAADPDRCRYFTFMRDPVERVASLHGHIVRKPKHPLHATVSQMSLIDFASSNLSRDVDNGQVRLVAGSNGEPGAASIEHLERAKANIEQRFVLVGFMEDFDAGLAELARRLKWHKRLRYERRNVAPGGTGVDAATAAMIRDRTPLDHELYGWAHQRFWGQ